MLEWTNSAILSLIDFYFLSNLSCIKILGILISLESFLVNFNGLSIIS